MGKLKPRTKESEELLDEFCKYIERENHPLIPWRGCQQQRNHFDLFLRAKDGNIEEAWKKLVNYHEWYEEKQLNIFPYEELKPELETGKILLMQKDLDNDPCILIRPALHFPGKFSRQQTMDLIASLFCKGISSMEDNGLQVTIVVDLKGFGYSNKDDGILKDAGALVSKYFPNRVKQLLIINAGIIINGLWSLIYPLVEQKFLDMIHFLKYPKDLRKYIPENDLPMKYGGVIVMDWKQWLQSSNEAFANQKDINLHRFCRRGQGLFVSMDELSVLQEEAESPFGMSQDEDLDRLRKLAQEESPLSPQMKHNSDQNKNN